MRMGMSNDHGGFGFKEELIVQLKVTGHEVVDFSAHQLTPDDVYPDYVVPLGQAAVTGISGSRRRLGMTATRSSRSGCSV